MDYKIAIPSYKRAETIKKKTLKLLSNYNIDPERIKVFVADKKEYNEYKKSLALCDYGRKIRDIKDTKILIQKHKISIILFHKRKNI